MSFADPISRTKEHDLRRSVCSSAFKNYHQEYEDLLEDKDCSHNGYYSASEVKILVGASEDRDFDSEEIDVSGDSE